jgi:flotillin
LIATDTDRLAEQWPEIVAAGAKAFGSVDQMVGPWSCPMVADGGPELFAKALSLTGPAGSCA